MPRFAHARARAALRPLPAPTMRAVSSAIVSSPGLEADFLVGAVAERLVLRLAAPAEPGLGPVPAFEPAPRHDRHVALDVERAVLDRPERELAAFGRDAGTLVADRAVVLEAGRLVAVVAERLVLRLAASTERGAEAHAGHVRRRALDRELAAREQRAVVGDRDRIARGGPLDRLPVLHLVHERTARAALDDVDDFGDGREIGLAPGLASADEEIALRAAALADVDAEPLVPDDVGVLAGVAVEGGGAHGGIPFNRHAGKLARSRDRRATRAPPRSIKAATVDHGVESRATCVRHSTPPTRDFLRAFAGASSTGPGTGGGLPRARRRRPARLPRQDLPHSARTLPLMTTTPTS